MLSRRIQRKAKRITVLTFLLLMIALWSYFFYNGLQVGSQPKKMLTQTVEWLATKVLQDPRGLLLTSLPALAWQDTPEEMENPGTALLSWVGGITHLNLRPTDILRAQIPLLAQVDQPGKTVITVLPEVGPPAEEDTRPVFSKDVLVGIYNTHTGETYTLTDGTDRLDGQRGGVVSVARAIQKHLQEESGIAAVRSDKIHDARYAASYLESEKTAKELVAQNPHMLAMLDIHRDAGRSRSQSLVEVQGKKVAPILFIIGSDARLPFPNWKQNYQLACKLAERINAKFPGLCLGVRVKEGRYNQFLHPGAILVEVGADNNSLEEALESADMLAQALAELIQEEVQSKAALHAETEVQEEESIEDESTDSTTGVKEPHTEPTPKETSNLEENV